MIQVSCKSREDWLAHMLESPKMAGFAVVTDVLPDSNLTEFRCRGVPRGGTASGRRSARSGLHALARWAFCD